MKHAKKFIGSFHYQKKVFDVIEQYIANFNQDESQRGYIFSENRTDSSIDLIIGSEKFTILAAIQGDGTIVFNVFEWIFDLASLTRYAHKKVDKLTFEKNGSSLCFSYPQTLDSRTQGYTVIINMSQSYQTQDIEPLLEQLEKYIYNKYEPLKTY